MRASAGLPSTRAEVRVRSTTNEGGPPKLTCELRLAFQRLPQLPVRHVQVKLRLLAVSATGFTARNHASGRREAGSSRKLEFCGGRDPGGRAAAGAVHPNAGTDGDGVVGLGWNGTLESAAGIPTGMTGKSVGAGVVGTGSTKGPEWWAPVVTASVAGPACTASGGRSRDTRPIRHPCRERGSSAKEAGRTSGTPSASCTVRASSGSPAAAGSTRPPPLPSHDVQQCRRIRAGGSAETLQIPDGVGGTIPAGAPHAGPGVVGQGGVPDYVTNVPPGAGVVGIGGDVLPPPYTPGDPVLPPKPLPWIQSAAGVGVWGQAKEREGVHGASSQNRGGVFGSERRAQVRLLPRPTETPGSTAYSPSAINPSPREAPPRLPQPVTWETCSRRSIRTASAARTDRPARNRPGEYKGRVREGAVCRRRSRQTTAGHDYRLP